MKDNGGYLKLSSENTGALTIVGVKLCYHNK